MRSKRQRESDEVIELKNVLAALPPEGPHSPFVRGPKVRGVEFVTVHADKLKSEHEVHLLALWSCMLRHPKPWLSVTLELSHPTQINYKEMNCLFSEVLLQYPAFVHHTVLWKCFLLTMQNHARPYNPLLFAGAINQAMKRCDENIASWWNLCINSAELLRLSQHEEAFQSSFELMAPLLIRQNQLARFSDLIDPLVLKRAVRHVDANKKPLLLHYAMQATMVTIDTIDKLIELLDARPTHLVDDKGNTLMHLCRHPQYIQSGLFDMRDMYKANKDGDYPIHQAARSANLAKAQYLFRYMIDPDIKNHHTGETFSNIVADKSLVVDQNASLCLYRKFRLNGLCLSLPTISLHQNGHTCGLYAVDYAARHHRSAQPTLFYGVKYLPPRKSDTKPPAEDSLRHHHKSKVGEVLSVAALIKLVALTGNKSAVIDLLSCEQFMQVIEAALRQDFPVIIPCCNKHGVPGVGDNATSAHWMTIIGFRVENAMPYLLVSQYGRYQEFAAQQVYDSCVKTNPRYPECYFVKDATKSTGWTKYLKAPVVSQDAKVRAIAASTLLDFFGKMVVVYPPVLKEEEVLKTFSVNADASSKRLKL